MPATSASVVIRIGRSRSRLAWMIASCRSHALRAQADRVIDLQDRVLLDDAEEQQHAERGVDVERAGRRCSDASRPNGTAIGSVSRIVTGWMNDSNCAASTMYMNDERQRERDAEVVGRAAELLRRAARDQRVARLHVEPREDVLAAPSAPRPASGPAPGFAEIVICRWRFRRSIDAGPVPSSKVTSVRSCTSSPLPVRTVAAAIDSGVRRKESCALSTTSY